MKHIITIVLMSIVILGSVTPVYAKNERQENRRANASSKPGLLEKLFNLKARAAIGTGTVTAKSGTTLTVEKDGKSYTVETNTKTQFRRRFWGKGSLEEIALGHKVNVVGLWTDDTKTTIDATLVRDLSVQKRNGVFMGIVKSLTTNGWVMGTVSEKRADQTVTVSSDTKFMNRRGETIVQSDVKVGHRVRVRGLWDTEANTVTEVTEVKDFNLPVISATPTATPTP